MRKKCELCRSVASMFCESDQASLCWDCDSRVHGANFLVAKHIRTLLCHACQSPTPWTGSGARLGPTVSVCDACASRSRVGVDGHRRDPRNGNTDDDDEDEDEDEDENEEDRDGEDDDEDDGENQVVPLSLPQSLDSTSSSTSSEETSSSSRRREGGATSSFGLSNATTTRTRSSYNSVERSEEETGARKVRSWKWR